MSEFASSERFDGEVVHRRYPIEDRVIRLRVSARELFFDDTELAVSNGFLCGGLEPTPEGKFRVLLAAARKPSGIFAPWAFIVSDRATARSILRAAGVEAQQQPFTLRSGGSVTWNAIGTFLLFLVGVLELSTLAVTFDEALLACVVFVGASVWTFVQWAARSSVMVGADGFVHRRYETSHFVPFSAVRDVAFTNAGLVVEQIDGRRRLLTSSPAMDPFASLREEDFLTEVIAMRIRDAIASQERTNATANDERREMPIAAWIRELRENPIAPPSYRMSPRREHDHDSILEDMTADVVTRACAAAALRIREGDAVIPRLRVAAAATASPKLRVALEKIAEGAPDDEIARRIEKLR